TTAMVLLGKTYGNLMVDLQATSDKLAARSRKILMDLFELNLTQADSLLTAAGGSVKTAIVMHQHKCDKPESEKLLKTAEGKIRNIKP
ncbi:MAG: N-acetylmuramic acid 6-phosphate etherase, partial [candidate division Zixibacteria bacterium]|nr:N-acetylmuramic acid 6-phosphate etherase [candidate division Zixibacteria bacterium]